MHETVAFNALIGFRILIDLAFASFTVLVHFYNVFGLDSPSWITDPYKQLQNHTDLNIGFNVYLVCSILLSISKLMVSFSYLMSSLVANYVFWWCSMFFSKTGCWWRASCFAKNFLRCRLLCDKSSSRVSWKTGIFQKGVVIWKPLRGKPLLGSFLNSWSVSSVHFHSIGSNSLNCGARWSFSLRSATKKLLVVWKSIF